LAEPPVDHRLQPLLRELEASDAMPFVVREADEFRLELKNYSAGRDASYVFVSLRASERDSNTAVRAVNIDPKNIPGTTIIYDATAETLQGKARPFSCDLSEGSRVYAILPYQIEAIELRAEQMDSGTVRLRVSFLDASDGRIQAALPFACWWADAAGAKSPVAYGTTDRMGFSSTDLRSRHAGHAWMVTVRSLLTGMTQSIQLEKQA
jgi:hypothetical protein